MSNISGENTWNEEKLVSLLRKGDEEAFRVLIKRYQARLLGITYGITLDKEESQEIVQDVFLIVYTKIHTFKMESKLSTWLQRITINQSLNWRRKWKRRARWHHQPLEMDDRPDLPELGTDEEGPDALFRKKELYKVFKENLQALPDETRAVFILKEIEGLSYEQIAKTMKIKRGTVSSRLFYARQKLKESIGDYLNGGEK